jgi:hypothetical protein
MPVCVGLRLGSPLFTCNAGQLRTNGRVASAPRHWAVTEPSPGADVGGVSPVPVQMWQGLTLSVLNATWPACSFVNAAVTSFVMLPLLGFGMMPRGPCIQIPADARPRALHRRTDDPLASPTLPTGGPWPGAC